MFDQAQKLRELVKQSKNNNQIDEVLSRNVKPQIITFVSGKSGIGKTVLLSNLALKLSNLNKKVIVLDNDSHTASVEFILNIAAKIKLIDIINDEKNLSVQFSAEDFNPTIVNCGSDIGLNNILDDEDTGLFINKLKKFTDIDYILIDTPSGLNKTAIDIAAFSDQVFVITSTDSASITESYAVVKMLLSKNKSLVPGILVNMVKNRQEALSIFDRINSVANKFLLQQLEFLGFVLLSSVVNQSIKDRRPFVFSSASSQPSIALSKLIDMLVSVDKKEKQNYFTCNV